jgi:hypothetical protein
MQVLIADALPRGLQSVAAPSGVMNSVPLSGHLLLRHHSHKAVRTGLDRSEDEISLGDALLSKFFRKTSSPRQFDLPRIRDPQNSIDTLSLSLAESRVKSVRRLTVNEGLFIQTTTKNT